MITAFILMNVEPGRIKPVAEALLEIPGIHEVYSVAGPFDLVAVARVPRHEDLSDLVTDRVGSLEGLETTETLIAFRAFSKNDPGMLWDVGTAS